MTQTILAARPDLRDRVLGGPSHGAASRDDWPRASRDMRAEEDHACLLVPCDRCGASQFQRCPNGQLCGARRLLAVERGHLDPDTGLWLTRGWALGREVGIEVGR